VQTHPHDQIPLVEDIYRQHYKTVLNFFSVHLSDRERCFDLSQEVFLRLLIVQTTGMIIKNPRSWLMRVASNVLIDCYRKRTREKDRHVDYAVEDVDTHLFHTDMFSRFIDNAQIHQNLVRTFGLLSPKACQLIYWREIEGLSPNAIAKWFGTTEGVVATQLSRARKQFRQAYLRYHFEGVLDPDEEILKHINVFDPFDPAMLPDEQLQAVTRRVRSYFDCAAATWDGYISDAYEWELAERIKTLLPWNDQMTVLDAGTGTGYMAFNVAPLVEKIIGIDHSVGMLKRAGEKASRYPQVKLLQGQADQLPIENHTVDVAMCHMLLHHTISPRQTLRELHRITRPGGFVVVVDADSHHHPWTLSEFGDVHYGIDRNTLHQQMIDLGLTSIHIEDVGISRSGASVGKSAIFTNFLAIARIPS